MLTSHNLFAFSTTLASSGELILKTKSEVSYQLKQTADFKSLVFLSTCSMCQSQVTSLVVPTFCQILVLLVDLFLVFPQILVMCIIFGDILVERQEENPNSALLRSLNSLKFCQRNQGQIEINGDSETADKLLIFSIKISHIHIYAKAARASYKSL